MEIKHRHQGDTAVNNLLFCLNWTIWLCHNLICLTIQTVHLSSIITYTLAHLFTTHLKCIVRRQLGRFGLLMLRKDQVLQFPHEMCRLRYVLERLTQVSAQGQHYPVMQVFRSKHGGKRKWKKKNRIERCFCFLCQQVSNIITVL